MAHPDHVDVVRRGTAALESWRTQNRGLRLDLRKADLRLQLLRQANLSGADLQGADLRGSDLRAANLRGADLRAANLRGANLGAADLSTANLGEANLSETNLTRAQLSATYLLRADLRGAHLAAADLHNANVSEANLRGADLRGANVRGAEFHEATVGWTSFGDLDLSATRSLETLRHDGPSTVGVDTLYKSKGKIPAPFLYGCGVPDRLLERATGLGLQESGVFDTCFISGSAADEAFCRHLCERMREIRIRVWPILEHDPNLGLSRGSAAADKLIVVFSEASLGEDWLVPEICQTRLREKDEDRRILFPVRLATGERIRTWQCQDPETEEDIAAELQKLYIPDFSSWQNAGSFNLAWQRLLSDLGTDSD